MTLKQLIGTIQRSMDSTIALASKTSKSHGAGRSTTTTITFLTTTITTITEGLGITARKAKMQSEDDATTTWKISATKRIRAAVTRTPDMVTGTTTVPVTLTPAVPITTITTTTITATLGHHHTSTVSAKHAH